MGLKAFFKSTIRLVKLLEKTEPKELWSSIKISIIGLAILGAIGFIIKFLALMFQPGIPTT